MGIDDEASALLAKRAAWQLRLLAALALMGLNLLAQATVLRGAPGGVTAIALMAGMVLSWFMVIAWLCAFRASVRLRRIAASGRHGLDRAGR